MRDPDEVALEDGVTRGQGGMDGAIGTRWLERAVLRRRRKAEASGWRVTAAHAGNLMLAAAGEPLACDLESIVERT
jgi:hypothetical protein